MKLKMAAKYVQQCDNIAQLPAPLSWLYLYLHLCLYLYLCLSLRVVSTMAERFGWHFIDSKS